MQFIIPNKLREMLSNLVVELWKCSQDTPYMSKTRRHSDAFRSFAAGVTFAMRRGMKLNDGTIIVPHSIAIERALSLTNTIKRGTVAHITHLQAHKGIGTLQRSIGSLPTVDDIKSQYEPAITIACMLQKELN